MESPEETAGLRLKAMVAGKEILIEGKNQKISSPKTGVLHIVWPLNSVEGDFIAELDERQISMRVESSQQIDWYWDLNVKAGAELPFTNIDSSVIKCEFDGMIYWINAKEGTFSSSFSTSVFRLNPVHNSIILRMDNRYN